MSYAEHLVALLPPEMDRVMFECSGSEANDLAVRVARAATGGTGVIVTSETYRGNTALITGLSPSIGTDQPMLPDMRMIPTPDTWRLGTNDIGAWMAARGRADRRYAQARVQICRAARRLESEHIQQTPW